MLKNENQRQIYIVVSQTGTILSRVLKLFTGAQYNHVSLSLTRNLDTMYSFGRRWAYNPFLGGMVKESPHHGTFKRFHKTEAVVLAIPVDEKLYKEMMNYLEEMYLDKENYHYNYLGLVLAAIKIHYHPTNRYYCSSFVKDVLVHFKLIGPDEMLEIVQPIHFMELFGEKKIYSGRLQMYHI